MEFQNNDSDWLNDSDDENEEEEVLDTVYLIMQKEIKEWKFDLKTGGTRFRFYRCYLKSITENKKQREDKIFSKNMRFKSMLKDGYTNEKIVKILYKQKIEKIRLEARLKELNISIYQISYQSYFPDLNKHGNLRSAFFKGTEIIY